MMSCDVEKHQRARVNLTGCNVFQLRQLTPDLLFHSGPAVFLTVCEESGTEGGLFLGVYCPSPERQWGGGGDNGGI